MTFLLASRAFLSRVPWQVWAALGLVVVIGLGVHRHGKAIKHVKAASYAEGYAKAVQVGIDEAAKQAAADAKITNELRSKSNEEVRVIARDADALRVRGAGQARCAPGHPVPVAASGRDPIGRRSDAAPVGMPDQDWAAVPFPWLVDQAEVSDANRAEVLKWREWHKRLSDARLASPSAP